GPDQAVKPGPTQAVTTMHAHGIEQSAIHKHLLEHSPQVWWTHIHAMGDPVQLATALKAVLDVTGIPVPKPPPAAQPPVDLDTAAVNGALGRTGTADGGLLKFTVARREQITDDGHVLPPTFGASSAINFQPVGGGRAAINGDFTLIGSEVNTVISRLRAGNINVVELHNHSLTDDPRLFYLHFWAVDEAPTLARTLRTALDATNSAPAK
ncbi:LppY/LpqO family protein, partial [Tsukamurella pulmonis]|uniref:LppY/LpqO family protein n=1 Tax=Tsukamurella pulmonis TaxID=47312 RepID=UPI000E097DC6